MRIITYILFALCAARALGGPVDAAAWQMSEIDEDLAGDASADAGTNSYDFAADHLDGQDVPGALGEGAEACNQGKGVLEWRAEELPCETRDVSSTHAGIIRIGANSRYTMVGGGMHNLYKKWDRLALFEESMPEGNHWRCDTGAGPGKLRCYVRACRLPAGSQCHTWSSGYQGHAGIIRRGVGSGYMMTGGGMYNHLRGWGHWEQFEESMPEENHWRCDLGFGPGRLTCFARGCRVPDGYRLDCKTTSKRANGAKEPAQVQCPSGYEPMGGGMYNHYRHFNERAAFVQSIPTESGWQCKAGLKEGDFTCYARCCQLQKQVCVPRKCHAHEIRGSDGFCANCELGKFKSGKSCAACPKGKHSHVDASKHVSTCLPCAAGKYGDATGQAKCTDCPKGQYSGAGASQCTKCPAGKYGSATSAPSASSCMVCPKGKYADVDGLAECKACPDRESNRNDHKSCAKVSHHYTKTVKYAHAPKTADWSKSFDRAGWSSVPSGTYITGFGNSGCDWIHCLENVQYSRPQYAMDAECVEVGWWHEHPQPSTRGYRTVCPAGYALSAIHRRHCVGIGCLDRVRCCKPMNSAARGSGLALEVKHAFEAKGVKECPDGTFAYGLVRSKCEQLHCIEDLLCGHFRLKECEGSAVLSKSGECLACPLGSSSAPGKVPFSPGTCKKCAKGKYSIPGNNRPGECRSCPVGHFTDAEGQTKCTRCPHGKIGPAGSTGAAACRICGAGQQVFYHNQIPRCGPCFPGTFKEKGETSCKVCPAGSVSGTRATSCSKCPVGKYAHKRTFPKGPACEACPIGKVAPKEGSTECTLCEQGTQKKGNACIPCAQGTVPYVRSTINNHGTRAYKHWGCRPCPAQTYQSGSVCQQCPSGKVQPRPGQVGIESCAWCPAGTFFVKKGVNRVTRTGCAPCPLGTTSVAGSTSLQSCRRCPEGTYGAKGQRGSECPACPAGKFNSVKGSMRCHPCSGIYFAPKEGLSRCLKCPAGKAASTDGKSCVQMCAPGSYKHSKTGKCTPCPAGTANPSHTLAGISACIPCPARRYNDKPGATGCKWCAAGTMTLERGQKACQKCLEGKFRPADRRYGFCFPCSPGTFAAHRGQAQCDRCPAGSYTVNHKTRSCTKCPAGLQSDETRTSCAGKRSEKCPAGTFVLHGAVCKTCPQGTYQGGEDKDSCDKCPRGTFNDDIGKSACTKCPAGKYGLIEGANTEHACFPCEAGKYSAALGRASKCELCPPGKYAASNGNASADACKPCQKQYYNPFAGQRACKRCRLNRTVSADRTKCEIK